MRTTTADWVHVAIRALAAMRRILIMLASAIVVAVLTLGFLDISDLLRLDDWSQWAVGIGLFATGGSVAGDIWWREFQALRASRRKQSLKRSTLGIRRRRLATKVRRRVRATRRSLRASKEVVGGFVFFGVLLLWLIALLVYANEDYTGLLRSIFAVPRS